MAVGPMDFVLVHGGWQGGWAWDKVAAVLRAGGHRVFAPTLRGPEDGDVDQAGLTLTDMAEGLLAEIDSQALRGFVLVGHSGGGPVAQIVVDRLADRVARMVFMNAWVLKDGESINDRMPPAVAQGNRAEAAQSPDYTLIMTPERWKGFMQDATPQQLAEVFPRLVPCPFGWIEQRAALPRFFGLRVPASYVLLRDDVSIPDVVYQEMIARLGDPLVVECPGSHQAMLTRPDDVARAILTAARG
jgi:pimeloyl-ACP methyl ester carboxylesterase